MIIIHGDQGSPAWHEARAGNPGASEFNKIVKTNGERSKSREAYLEKLVDELINGPAESFSSGWMARGLELEPEARAAYQVLTGYDVDQCSMVYQNETLSYHVSPDGLVRRPEDGQYLKGLEIKCPSPAVHEKFLWDGTLPTKFIQQVQGGMLVTGLPQWDFFSYHPDIDSLLITVDRDEEFIRILGRELEIFCRELRARYDRRLEAL